MGYIHNVMPAFDQLANVLYGGNPDNTVSASVGYFAQVNRNANKYYWRITEKLIDFTYWPVDGPGHCRQAFEADPEEVFFNNNSDFFRFIMSIIIVAIYIPVIIFLYTGWAIGRFFGIKDKKQKGTA